MSVEILMTLWYNSKKNDLSRIHEAWSNSSIVYFSKKDRTESLFFDWTSDTILIVSETYFGRFSSLSRARNYPHQKRHVLESLWDSWSHA